MPPRPVVRRCQTSKDKLAFLFALIPFAAHIISYLGIFLPLIKQARGGAGKDASRVSLHPEERLFVNVKPDNTACCLCRGFCLATALRPLN
jgi:hypothetical protein